MNWPFPPRPRETIAIVAVLLLIGGMLVWMVFPHNTTNFGFGPEWRCEQNLASGGQGPICFKDRPSSN
jgi:hypothetical protein